MNNAEIADVLEKAAGLIETVGWTQGNWVNTDDDGNELAYCSIGAIRRARRFNTHLGISYSSDESVYKALLRQIGTCTTAPFMDGAVVRWNDNPVRTREEVVDTFKLAAKDLRNQS